MSGPFPRTCMYPTRRADGLLTCVLGLSRTVVSFSRLVAPS